MQVPQESRAESRERAERERERESREQREREREREREQRAESREQRERHTLSTMKGRRSERGEWCAGLQLGPDLSSSYWFAASHSSIHWLYTSIGSDR